MADLAEFDERGLWSYGGGRFSKAGTLIETAIAFETASEMGYYVDELDKLFDVDTRGELCKLGQAGRLSRHKIRGCFLY